MHAFYCQFLCFLLVENERPYKHNKKSTATIVRSYYGDNRADECTKIDLNKITAIYFPQVLIHQHAKLSADTFLAFSNLPVISRVATHHFIYTLRFFVNKGENYVNQCHHRFQDNSEVVVEEVKTRHKLNNKYFQFVIGSILQKIVNSLYWRYGMSLVISLEPNVVNPDMIIDDTFPLTPELWYMTLPSQPGGSVYNVILKFNIH